MGLGCAFFVLLVLVEAVGADLPSGLEGCMPARVAAAVMEVPSTGNVELVLRARFCNEPARRVSLLWSFTSGDHGGSEDVAVPVHFRPTAIAAGAGVSDRIYVAGWLEDTGQAVVDEWVFGDGVVLSGVDASGEGVVTFVPPSFTTRRVFTSEPGTFGPAWGVAPYVEAGSLLYLEHVASAGERALWSIDVSSGATSRLGSTADDDGLAHGRSIVSGLSADEGRVIVVSRVGPFGGNAGGSGWPTFVMQDTDLDGVVDVMQTMTQSELAAAFDGPWLADG